MKKWFNVSLLAFMLIFITCCTNSNKYINGIWEMKNLSQEIAGKVNSMSTNSYYWEFRDMKTLDRFTTDSMIGMFKLKFDSDKIKLFDNNDSHKETMEIIQISNDSLTLKSTTEELNREVVYIYCFKKTNLKNSEFIKQLQYKTLTPSTKECDTILLSNNHRLKLDDKEKKEHLEIVWNFQREALLDINTALSTFEIFFNAAMKEQDRKKTKNCVENIMNTYLKYKTITEHMRTIEEMEKLNRLIYLNCCENYFLFKRIASMVYTDNSFETLKEDIGLEFHRITLEETHYEKRAIEELKRMGNFYNIRIP